jgi:predicted neuraminidase
MSEYFKRMLSLPAWYMLLFSIPAIAQRTGVELDDPGMEVPCINVNPLPRYRYDRLDYGMTIGIERTKGGRIWSCWVAGGDNEEAFFVLNTSDNNGKTWSNPRMVIDPHNISLSFKRRTIVGALWLDPDGKLWLFFDQAMTYFDGRSGNWYITCSNPDDKSPVWSRPQYISYGCTLNKPIVLSNGEWLLPVSLWDRGKIRDAFFSNAYHELDSLREANLFISKDKGKTWNRLGGVSFPNPQFDEHHVIERRDGSLWMTARTGNGIFQSSSYDSGKTWSKPEKYLPHIGSRHFIRRLSSGNLLLVKHGRLEETTKLRSKLMAFISDDDGKTWKGGLMLDERRGVSYPDGFQAPDGTIFISYDRNRETDGEILMVHFTEKDVLNGQIKGKSSPEHTLISRPIGLDKLPAPSVLMK